MVEFSRPDTIAVLSVMIAWSTSLFAQEKPTYTVKVDVVQIVASVKDEKGRIVTDLGKDDFILEEEGEPQEIRYFAKQTDAPLTIGLLVDSSMSQRQVLEEERRASYQFFEQVLRPEKDRAFVISFDVDVELLQDMTGSLPRLNDSLKHIEVPGNREQRQIGTVLFDAVFLSADEVLIEPDGRKALILISDGVDFGSMTGSATAIKAVHRADTLIYSIRYYAQRSYGGFGTGRRRSGRRPTSRQPKDGEEVLRNLSEQTGGSLFEVSKKLTLEKIFDQIQAELRGQYLIEYTPPKNSSSKEFRTISLRTRNKKLKVYCRSGYYP